MHFRYAEFTGLRDVKPTYPDGGFDALCARLSHTVGEKGGSGFSACVFKDGGKRCRRDVEVATAVVIDIDGGVDDVDAFAKAFPWRGVIYSTAGHAVGKPRFRVLLPLSVPVSSEYYRDVIWPWIWRTSEGKADKQCCNPDRLYFYPRVPEVALSAAFVIPLHGEFLRPEECVARDEREDDAVAEAVRAAVAIGSRNRAGYDMARKMVSAGAERDAVVAAGKRYIAAAGGGDYTLDEFMASVEQVFLHPPDKKKKAGKGKDDDYPFIPVAAAILADHPIITSAEGNAYEYNGVVWASVSPCRIDSLAQEYDTTKCAKSRDIKEVTSYIARTTHVGIDAIQWNRIAASDIPFDDGVLNVLTMQRRAHSEHELLDTVLPHGIPAAAKTPIWDRCCAEWFMGPEIDAKTRLLQEFFGYILLPHARFKKCLLMYGDSNTGKSVVANLMCHVVGITRTSSVSVSDMDDRKLMSSLRGSMLNIVSEISINAKLSDGGFKALVAGDPISIEKKYKAPETYTPTAKVVIATNNLPEVNDHTRAVFNRLLILHFGHAIAPHTQDPDIIDKLKEEMPGVIMWAVNGARRLLQNKGSFTQVDSGESAVADYKAGSNPIIEFMEENTVGDEAFIVRISELRCAFIRWSGTRVSPIGFGRMLGSIGLKSIVVREASTTARCVKGLQLKERYA